MKRSKDPSGLSYTQIAARLGINRNAIYVMRLQQPERFAYVHELHPHFEEGYRRYRQMQSEVMLELQGIYYELEEKRLISSFSRYLYKLGIYGSKIGWANSAVTSLFKFDVHRLSHSGLLRKIAVIKAYETFTSGTS